MLNRRILRVKAMQGLYAYYNCREANYNISIEKIGQEFDSLLVENPELDKKDISKQKNQAIRLFGDYASRKKKIPEETAGNNPEIRAREAHEFFLKSNQKDFTSLRKKIIQEAEKIFDIYLWLLILPEKFAGQVEAELQEKLAAGLLKGKDENPSRNLKQNKVIQKISGNTSVTGICKQKKISWDKYREHVHDWYKNYLKKDKEFKTYLSSPSPRFNDDLEFILYLFKNILFKCDGLNDFLESEDLYWKEDRKIIKSMILKTIKGITEENQNIELAVLSKNWEDDRYFFQQIFEKTVEHDEEYDEIIAKKSENWDISRIALTDRIIIKMAIGEMICFPGIPIKVTINEYIELSKNFSTPKSRKFVNGILDVASIELKEKGIIKKSGRGLIDNR